MRVFKAHSVSQMPCVADGRLSGIITGPSPDCFLVEGRDIETPLCRGDGAARLDEITSTITRRCPPQLFERGEIAIVVDESAEVSGHSRRA
ncbi:MAG: hypothetical protein R3B82_26000 [Sandaracinaceae bacterium]